MAAGITKFLSKWIHWIKFKGWFIFDLPYFIKERKYTTGLELGAKAGRSMYYTLKANKSLHLTGIDLWEIIPGGAYKKNNINQYKCKRLLQKFSSRIILIKGDAFTIADTIENKSFDFIFYDLQCKTMTNFHKYMIARWLPKIKKGGVLIGRDFREFRQTFYDLGFTENDIKICQIGKRLSVRLEYIVVN